VDISGVKWHGSTFDISIGQRTTTLTERSGPPLAVRDGSGKLHKVKHGTPLHLTTRHPAATPGPVICNTPVTGVASARCVDIAGGNNGDGTPLQLYDCNGTTAQTWSMPGDGTVRAMGTCMDVRGGSGADSTAVQVHTCDGTASQQWTYDPTTKALKAFGECLNATASANGTSLQLADCTGSRDQQWKFPS
jgi:hypothetical protein